MLSFIQEYTSVWKQLSAAKKPIVLYGTGNGADKILDVFSEYGISIAGVFASDDFVRGQSFHGYSVLTYDEIKKQFDDFIIVLGFGSSIPSVVEHIKELNRAHELYAPDVPLFGHHIFDLEFVSDNSAEIEKAYHMLADSQSRKVYENIVNYKISGKIQYLLDCETDKKEAFDNILKLTANESYLDAGAYDADTIFEFLRQTGNNYREIIALEPDIKNYQKLCNNIGELVAQDINLLNIGVYNKQCEISFCSAAGRNSCINQNGNVEIQVNTIDNIIGEDQVTLVKLDVEGVEKKALEGTKHTLVNCRPKLIVSAYHRSRDLYELPIYIKSICPQYKIYMRKHPSLPAWDINLYATIH